MKRYIEVTQDAAAIINDDTPEEIIGLYTSELETCVAIVIKGSLGILMLHHSGHLGEDGVRLVVEKLGQIEKVLMFSNSDSKYQEFVFENLDRILSQSIFEELADKIEYCSIPSQSLSVNRNFKGQMSSINQDKLISPINKEIRIRTNALNNLTDPNLAVDLQYDGKTLTPCTTLSENIEETYFKCRPSNPIFTAYQKTILLEAIRVYLKGLETYGSSSQSSLEIEEIEEKSSSPRP